MGLEKPEKPERKPPQKKADEKDAEMMELEKPKRKPPHKTVTEKKKRKNWKYLTASPLNKKQCTKMQKIT